MKMAFVARDPSASYGIMALSAYVKSHGHDSELFIPPLEDRHLDRLADASVGLVAFSATTGRHMWVLEQARLIKDRLGLPVVMGGPHPTYFPQVIAHDALDYICVGEGEGALLDLLNALSSGSDPSTLPNLGTRSGGEIKVNPVRDLIDPLDQLPFVDREIYLRYPLTLAYQRDTCLVMTGRGCPYNCSFCYNASCRKMYKGKGTYLRKRSVEHVLAEMESLKTRHGIRRFIIDDDTLTYDADWLEEFAGSYAVRVGCPFTCNVRAENLTDRVVQALRRAGCTGVKMGVETADEALRAEVLNKPIRNETLLAGVMRLRAAGIQLQTFNILGIPGGSLDKDWETLRFNQTLKPVHAWCSLMNPYPGTAIRDVATQRGMIQEGGPEEFSRDSYFVDTPLRIEDKMQVINLHHLFDIAVKTPSLTPVVRALVRLPLTSLYEKIFKIDHAFSIWRFYRIRLLTWIRFLWSCRGIY